MKGADISLMSSPLVGLESTNVIPAWMILSYVAIERLNVNKCMLYRGIQASIRITGQQPQFMSPN